MYDVPQEEYTTVIREMIKHENDVTNHRIMWLLIGQGFIANAFVSAQKAGAPVHYMFSFAGILVALSAFVMLFKSYRARAYLQFLGEQAKLGKLEAIYLPLLGWPRTRMKSWWKKFWICSWLGQAGDVMEPWMFLPSLFMLMWLSVILYQHTGLEIAANVILAGILTVVILPVCCILLVWTQDKDVKQKIDDSKA